MAQCLGAIGGAAVLLLLVKWIPGVRAHERLGSNGWGSRSAVHIDLGGATVAPLVGGAMAAGV